MKPKSALIPTLTKIKEGYKIDAYNVSVNIEGVEIPAGTLYILRSLLQERRIKIDIGPAVCTLQCVLGADVEPSTDVSEESPDDMDNNDSNTETDTTADNAE